MYDATLGLGKQLRMEVVAEEVEDHDDWDLVRRTDGPGFFHQASDAGGCPARLDGIVERAHPGMADGCASNGLRTPRPPS